MNNHVVSDLRLLSVGIVSGSVRIKTIILRNLGSPRLVQGENTPVIFPNIQYNTVHVLHWTTEPRYLVLHLLWSSIGPYSL